MEPRTGIDLASLRALQQKREALQPGELFSYSEDLRSVMVSPVHTCPPEEDLQTAISTMAREGISSMVAVDPEGAPVGIDLPLSVKLKVIETEPPLRGATAAGSAKPAKLETGAIVQVPLFIKEGETIRVDTRSGEYVERVG